MALSVKFRDYPRMEKHSPNDCLRKRLEQSIADKYGHMIGGADLANLLGYRSTDTLRKAVANQTLTLKTFVVPGRQGRFALTAEVTDWLIAMRSQSHAAVEGQQYCGLATGNACSSTIPSLR
jgi:hypothetical protein